jgi:small-conductance mechanosensitive channel
MTDDLAAWMRHYGLSVGAVIGTIAILLSVSIAVIASNLLLRRLLPRLRPRFHMAPDTILFFTRIWGALLWICAALLILQLWGLSVSGLWALLASVAALIGVGFLAVWTIISNMTASFFITIWHPFRLGETVELLPEGLSGRVIDRNLMFTVLREKSGTTLRIPNNLFFQKIFRVIESDETYLFEFLEHGRAPTPSGVSSEETDIAAP